VIGGIALRGGLVGFEHRYEWAEGLHSRRCWLMSRVWSE